MISISPQSQPLLLSAHSLPNEKHPCDVRCCRMEELENSISASTTRQHHFKEQRHRFALNQRQIFAVIKKGFFIFSKHICLLLQSQLQHPKLSVSQSKLNLSFSSHVCKEATSHTLSDVAGIFLSLLQNGIYGALM